MFEAPNESARVLNCSFLSVRASRPYNATVYVYAVYVSEGGTVTRVLVAEWNFTAHSPDVSEAAVLRGRAVRPQYGPGGTDCLRGLRVDGIRSVTSFLCSQHKFFTFFTLFCCMRFCHWRGGL